MGSKLSCKIVEYMIPLGIYILQDDTERTQVNDV